MVSVPSLVLLFVLSFVMANTPPNSYSEWERLQADVNTKANVIAGVLNTKLRLTEQYLKSHKDQLEKLTKMIGLKNTSIPANQTASEAPVPPVVNFTQPIPPPASKDEDASFSFQLTRTGTKIYIFISHSYLFFPKNTVIFCKKYILVS
jgi:hypothetical protein